MTRVYGNRLQNLTRGSDGLLSSASSSHSPSPSVNALAPVKTSRSGRRIQPRSHSGYDDEEEEVKNQDKGDSYDVHDVSTAAGPSSRKLFAAQRSSASRRKSANAINAESDLQQKKGFQSRKIKSKTATGAAAAAQTSQLKQIDSEEDEEAREKRIRQEQYLMERWQEDYNEIIDQLPLELQRSYTLMRELETKFQSRISQIANQTKEYRDARSAFNNLPAEEKEQEVRLLRQEAAEAIAAAELDMNQGKQIVDDTERRRANDVGADTMMMSSSSSDADAEGEDDAEVYQVLAGEAFNADKHGLSRSSAAQSSEPERKESAVEHKAPASSKPAATPPNTYANPTMRQSRLDILASIARASSEALRIADEKVGVAVTAYDWVDRQIRRLDGDLQKNENSLFLGLRAGTEASRGLQDALGVNYDEGDGAHQWEDVEQLLLGRANGASNAGNPPASTRKRDSKRKSSAAVQRNKKASQGNDDEDEEAQHTGGLTHMAIDPNEPTYCYCDQVSYGDMVACDNEDCPREWFHYPCIGFKGPPKGRWFCLFCAPPGFKGSGTFPPDAPCLPSGLGGQYGPSSTARTKNSTPATNGKRRSSTGVSASVRKGASANARRKERR